MTTTDRPINTEYEAARTEMHKHFHWLRQREIQAKRGALPGMEPPSLTGPDVDERKALYSAAWDRMVAASTQ